MKRLLPLVVVGLALTACGSSGHATVANGFGPRFTHIRPPSPTSLRFSTPSNRAFARRDVQKLLGLVVLPESAKRVADVPKSAPSWFRRELGAHFDGAAIARRVWVVHQPLKQVVLFVRAHAPPRPRPMVPFRKPSNRVGSRPSENLLFHPVPGRSWSRWLNVNMLALPGGSTVVVAQAGDAWLHTPPRSAEIPAGVKRIDITSRLGNLRPNVLVHVRRPYDVGSIVSWTNGLGVSPNNIACLTIAVGGPNVTLTFRGADGSVLARAHVRDVLGSGSSGPCNPLVLTLHGKALQLIGSDLLHRIEQHLDIDLAPPTPSAVAGCLRNRGWKVQTVLHGGFVTRKTPTPAQLTAAHAGHRWLITFHATGKVTTDRAAPRAISRCLRTGIFHLGGFG